MADEQEKCKWVKSFFWHRLTREVPDKRLQNGCVYASHHHHVPIFVTASTSAVIQIYLRVLSLLAPCSGKMHLSAASPGQASNAQCVFLCKLPKGLFQWASMFSHRSPPFLGGDEHPSNYMVACTDKSTPPPTSSRLVQLFLHYAML